MVRGMHIPRRWICWLLLTLPAISSLFAFEAGAKDVASGLRAQIDPAIARVRVVSVDYSEGRVLKEQAVGSGAIITSDGYLITNHHVAGHATRMFCTLWNREE